jgi:hypothetical protein
MKIVLKTKAIAAGLESLLADIADLESRHGYIIDHIQVDEQEKEFFYRLDQFKHNHPRVIGSIFGIKVVN